MKIKGMGSGKGENEDRKGRKCIWDEDIKNNDKREHREKQNNNNKL
jgi:hypothetical protein